MGTVCVQGSFAKPSAPARVEITQQCRNLYNTYRALEVRTSTLRQQTAAALVALDREGGGPNHESLKQAWETPLREISGR